MNQYQERLLSFASDKGLPFILQHEKIKDWIDELSFVIVGSTATGLCDEDSDLDIAIICENHVFNEVSKGTPWANGRPSEVHIDGIQMHYFAISFEKIIDGFNNLDDSYLYIFSKSIILRDLNSNYRKKICAYDSTNETVKKNRIEGKLDMLLRRKKAFDDIIEKSDLYSIAQIKMELFKRILQLIALIDDIPFENRKRLFNLSTKGATGKILKSELLVLCREIGNYSYDDAGKISFGSRYQDSFVIIIETICRNVKALGYQVGLAKMDLRQIDV